MDLCCVLRHYLDVALDKVLDCRVIAQIDGFALRFERVIREEDTRPRRDTSDSKTQADRNHDLNRG